MPLMLGNITLTRATSTKIMSRDFNGALAGRSKWEKFSDTISEVFCCRTTTKQAIELLFAKIWDSDNYSQSPGTTITSQQLATAIEKFRNLVKDKDYFDKNFRCLVDTNDDNLTTLSLSNDRVSTCQLGDNITACKNFALDGSLDYFNGSETKTYKYLPQLSGRPNLYPENESTSYFQSVNISSSDIETVNLSTTTRPAVSQSYSMKNQLKSESHKQNDHILSEELAFTLSTASFYDNNRDESDTGILELSLSDNDLEERDDELFKSNIFRSEHNWQSQCSELTTSVYISSSDANNTPIIEFRKVSGGKHKDAYVCTHPSMPIGFVTFNTAASLQGMKTEDKLHTYVKNQEKQELNSIISFQHPIDNLRHDPRIKDSQLAKQVEKKIKEEFKNQTVRYFYTTDKNGYKYEMLFDYVDKIAKDNSLSISQKKDIAMDFHDKFAEAINILRQNKICHGDPHGYNWIISIGNDSKISSIEAIDWDDKCPFDKGFDDNMDITNNLSSMDKYLIGINIFKRYQNALSEPKTQVRRTPFIYGVYIILGDYQKSYDLFDNRIRQHLKEAVEASPGSFGAITTSILETQEQRVPGPCYRQFSRILNRVIYSDMRFT